MTRRYDDPVDVVDVRRRVDRHGSRATAVTAGGDGGGHDDAASAELTSAELAPAEFLWRGRLYVVREVLAHWVETGPWWRSAAARALLGTDAAAGSYADGSSLPESASGPALGGPGLRAPAGPPLPPPQVGALDPDDVGERQVWRVEASAGRTRGSGVYDLCSDGAGRWTLTRALD